MKRLTLALFIVTMTPVQLYAQATPAPGNLLVSTDNVLHETTLDGVVVQSIDIEHATVRTVTETARDIAAGLDGIVHVYNGMVYPTMSSFDPVEQTWSHLDFGYWGSTNNISYGGIDVVGNSVFATDMRGDGVIVFDTDTGQSLRFAVGTDPIDLTVGLDGLLYVLSPGGSPGGRTVDVYDPETYALIRSIDLTAIFGWTEHRALAVDYNGDLFLANWFGDIRHVSADGVLLNTISPPCGWTGRDLDCSFTDINISENGQLALGTRFGEIILTDVYFSTTARFEIGDRTTFVDFVPLPPQPTEVTIDVRPGRFPNKINLARKKNLWVSILTDSEFDASTVDPESVALGSGGAGINRNPKLVDTDGDGDLDLKLRFRVADIGIACGDTSLSLAGMTFDGTEIVGSDSIVTKGCN